MYSNEYGMNFKKWKIQCPVIDKLNLNQNTEHSVHNPMSIWLTTMSLDRKNKIQHFPKSRRLIKIH